MHEGPVHEPGTELVLGKETKVEAIEVIHLIIRFGLWFKLP